MTRVPAPDALPEAVRRRSARHRSRYDAALKRFRLAVQQEFEGEVERLRRQFVDGPLRRQAAPVVAALGDYVSWLGWCVWCSAHLAPPLAVDGRDDARRVAAALIVYSGPRLIDDGIDDHRSYKGVRETTLERLARAFPEACPALLRSQVTLLGTWVLLHGLQRLRRHGGPEAAERTLRLCERIAPGVVLESLHAAPLSWDQYQQVVTHKAVLYDEILYRNLLDPVSEPLKGRVLQTAGRLSRLAQYLNDFADRRDDQRSARANTVAWFPTEGEFWEVCQAEGAAMVASFDELPVEVGDAFSASLVDTFTAAARLEQPLAAARQSAVPASAIQGDAR